MGDSRVFLADALGGFYSLREQVAQEIGPEAEADIVQRAGFASAERLVAAGCEGGEISSDETGFHKALSLLSFGGYGLIRATEVRFEEQWARVVVEGSVEAWMFREAGTRPHACCDFMRGLLAGIMHFMAARACASEFAEESAFGLEQTSSSEPVTPVEISCVETSCVAAGDETCQFVLGPTSLLIAEGLTPAPIAHSSVRETLLRLNRQLEQILDSSRKDPLTKLFNRSYFEAALRQRIGYAKRRSDVVSLAIIDIDFFKQVNDTHGHTVGDRVLRQIARSIEQQARENDIVSRLGGDEFVWLMPATAGEAALAVAQRLRRTIDELAPSIGFSISASIGVANYPQDASSPAELFECADSALFSAKRAGRDRAVRYSPTPSAPAQGGGNGGNGGYANGIHSVNHTTVVSSNSAPHETPNRRAIDAPPPPSAPVVQPEPDAFGFRGAVKPRRTGQPEHEQVEPSESPSLAGHRRIGNGLVAEPERETVVEEQIPLPSRVERRLKKVRY